MPRNKNYDENLVLEKALNTFWGNGYKATSIRMLEKEMGINQFSIYSSFNSKKELFLKSVGKYREYVQQNIYKDLLKPDSGLAELKTFLLGASNSQTAKFKFKGCMIVNTVAELGNSDPEIANKVESYYNFIREMLKNILITAIKKNEISPNIDVEQQANFFLGVMQGLSVASRTMDTKQINDFISVAIAQIE